MVEASWLKATSNHILRTRTVELTIPIESFEIDHEAKVFTIKLSNGQLLVVHAAEYETIEKLDRHQVSSGVYNQ